MEEDESEQENEAPTEHHHDADEVQAVLDLDCVSMLLSPKKGQPHSPALRQRRSREQLLPRSPPVTPNNLICKVGGLQCCYE